MAGALKLLVFTPYYPPHIGGLESHAAQFNKAMSALDCSPTVITFQLPRSSLPFEVKEKTTIYRLPAVEIIRGYPLPALWQPSFWILWRAACAPKPDIVLSRTRFFSTSYLAGLYARRHLQPWVHVEHGSDFVQTKNSAVKTIAYLFDRTLGALVLHQATAVVANSKASAAFVKMLGGRAAAVIYRGVNHATITTSSPDESYKKLFPGKVLLAYVGRLMPGKGVQDLLQSLAQLKHEHCHLLIIGDGPYRVALERQVHVAGLGKQVTFCGERTPLQTLALLKSVDIVINPSYSEGLPSALIEAALLGKAIIATDVGGTPEIVEDGKSACLYPPHHTGILKDHLQRLVQNLALRQQLGRAAYERVSKKFHWKDSARQYMSLFTTLLP